MWGMNESQYLMELRHLPPLAASWLAWQDLLIQWPQPWVLLTSTCHQVLAVPRGLEPNFLFQKWGLGILTSNAFTHKGDPALGTSPEKAAQEVHSPTCLTQANAMFLTQANDSLPETGILGK